MEFFPELQLGWLNGWLPLVIFYLVFVCMMAIFPRPVVQRLYDLPKFEGRSRYVWIGGRIIFILFLLGLLVFSPLQVGAPVFVIAAIVYLIGFIVIVSALITYRNTPLDHPVIDGLYRYSRNPQALGLMLIFLGCCLAVGSWLLVLAWIMLVGMNHLRIVREEQLCLAQYGDSYRAYMASVPRYFLII